MRFSSSIVQFSVGRPRLIVGLMLFATLLFMLLAALPSIWPHTFGMLNSAQVDTDPENMLPEDEAVRIFHDQMKYEFSLYDMVVLGVVNEVNPQGVFNPQSLQKIYEITEYAKRLNWKDEDNQKAMNGVIEVDIIAPSTVDNIEQGGLGVVKFEWLMPSPPATKEAALAIKKKAERIPFLNGTVISEDGKALCLYLPLSSKDISYRVYSKLREKIASFKGDERYFITGLPVAEDTFGVEMFKQMVISAPIAMLVIFLLMFFFFRKLTLIISPMIVALISVISTMGLLIVTGHTIHIMSSMIPIFIMPISVLDGIHILSEFFDRYQETKNRRTTILNVMETLFTPMLYTSLTTAAGFASLALTPIPPVQVFGLFVALGVMLAWLWTISFIPAYIMFIPQKSLENFGLAPTESNAGTGSLLSRFLPWLGRVTYQYAKPAIIVTVILTLVAIYGISQIQINDNPIKWFTPSHPIRVADKVLNEHFGGTYMAYLALEPLTEGESPGVSADVLIKNLRHRAEELNNDIPNIKWVLDTLSDEVRRLHATASSKADLLHVLESFAATQAEAASADMFAAWDEALLFIDQQRLQDQLFKQPTALNYLADLQNYLLTTGVVGKSNSLADIVKTVYRELLVGDPQKFRVPDSANAVAQCLITYQNSHRPQDLWHFVTPDYRKTSIWVQLKSGDNRDMAKVVKAVDQYIKTHPPPFNLHHQWFGLTYINVIWQDKMVSGMLQAFLGSFLVVLLMMIILFNSALWGLLCMIPLTITIALIYGIIGLTGKDYDMPVAVLSSLSLGLAVDYAIHFLVRSRKLYENYKTWSATAGPVFGEPARAIIRNVLVIGMGFLPLLATPLVPYQTVGMFIAAILLTAGIATLIILPAMITLLEPWLFPKTNMQAFSCMCATCIFAGIVAVTLIAVNVHQFLSIGWTKLSWISLVAILVMTGICYLFSRRKKCKIEPPV